MGKLLENAYLNGAEKKLAETESREPVYVKLSAFDLQKEIAKLKNLSESDPTNLSWLKGVSKCVPQAAIEDACLARDRWLFPKKGVKRAGKPKFQNRRNQTTGVRFSDGTGGIRITEHAVRLPILGEIKLSYSAREQAIQGTYTSASLTIQDGKMYVSVFIERPKETQPESDTNPMPTLGIDVGCRVTVSCSDGTTYNHPESLERSAKREHKLKLAIARKQRAAMKKRQNKPYAKCERREPEGRRITLARKKLKKACNKTARIRKDSCRQIAASIAKNHKIVACENLRVTNMMKAKKGKGRAAKAGLNRCLANAAFAMILSCLDWSLTKNGGTLIRVAPHNTSRTCSSCGWTYNIKKSTVFKCADCGLQIDRDLNASINILERGCSYVALGCEETKNARDPRGGELVDTSQTAMGGAGNARDPVAHSEVALKCDQ